MASQDRRPDSGPDIVAAGAVVVRRDNGGEVLLVHRPKYDDWSWPKGKQDPGEHVTVTAVREVLEETGVEVRLGRPLPPQYYAVASGRTKTVHYWTGRVVGDDDLGAFRPNDEIDEVAWVGIEKARRLLTYADDVELLDRVAKHRRNTRSLVLLRHARARKRVNWEGPDPERPLTDVGRLQAKALAPVLAAFGITRVVSSDSVRCLRTVSVYARDQVLPVEAVTAINEDDFSAHTVAQTVEIMLAAKENAVLCSHRPVLPQLFAQLGIEEEPLAPGELVVCHHRKGKVVATERHLVR